ncbi:MAG: RluA family pseudouridine synthase [Desulfovibrionaceae bacterium]
MQDKEKSFIVSASQEGVRLDKALLVLLPDSGLRQRRRLAENDRVFVDGLVRGPAWKLRSGQYVELLPDPSPVAPCPDLVVVARQGGYAAVHKPAGLHSATVVGSGNPSAEALLVALFPGEHPVLLNRLDQLTSGLLLVELDAGAGKLFRSLEKTGQVRKEYTAKVAGRLDEPLELQARLDVVDRVRTRVLDDVDPDPARWTLVTPLAYDGEQDASLVRAVIRRGARHQIRAHLAHAGHPLWGDPLYGGRSADRLYLHHCRICFDGFQAESPIGWEATAF